MTYILNFILFTVFILFTSSHTTPVSYSNKLRVKRQLDRRNLNDDRPVWDTRQIDNRYALSNQNNNINQNSNDVQPFDVFFDGSNNSFDRRNQNIRRQINNNNFGFGGFNPLFSQGFNQGRLPGGFNNPGSLLNNFNNNVRQNERQTRPSSSNNNNNNNNNTNRPLQNPSTINSPSRSFLSCMANCQTTNQYNPVCGTDNMTYHNDQKLLCAQNCGASKSLLEIVPSKYIIFTYLFNILLIYFILDT